MKTSRIDSRSLAWTSAPTSLERSTLEPVSCVFRSDESFSTTSWATSLSRSVSWKLKSTSSISFSESFFSETILVREENASLSFSNIGLA